PITESDGSRLKSETNALPSDSWAWRKRGQKPIKGSPYPRLSFLLNAYKAFALLTGDNPTGVLRDYAQRELGVSRNRTANRKTAKSAKTRTTKTAPRQKPVDWF
ncbi:probable WRKY transcription factor 65 isoform X1, partial [Tanacetum coccineum]